MVSTNFQNSIINNINISKYDKLIMLKEIEKIDMFFSKFDIEIPYENSTFIFDKLSVLDTSNSDIISVKYNSEENHITQNFNPDNFKYDKFEYEYIKVLLSLLSKKYNIERKQIESGLAIKNGIYEYGTKINELLISSVATLISNYSEDKNEKDFFVDNEKNYYTLPDILLNDIYEKFGSEKILNYFINSCGDDFFYEIASILGEYQTIELLNSIDYYEKDKINNRKIYDEKMEQLKKEITYDMPKM